MAYERLKKLGDARFTEIQDSLLKGISSTKVAQIIQVEWGEFKDIPENTLSQQLKRLGMDLKSPTKPVEKVVEKVPISVEKNEDIEDAPPEIDCQKEYGDLIRLQKLRIASLIEKEKSMPVPYPHLSQMIKEHAEMIKMLEKAQRGETDDIWAQLFSSEGGAEILSTKGTKE